MPIIRKNNKVIRKTNNASRWQKALGVIKGPEYKLCVKGEDDDRVISLQYWKIEKGCISVPDRGYVEAWENVTVTWSGTKSDPYIVSSSWGWGWVVDCDWVITCVEEAENIVLQWNLTVEWTSIFEWDANFEWANVNFTDTTINNIGVTENYDETSSVTYNWTTIDHNNTTETYNSSTISYDGDTSINYDNTTIEGGIYTDVTLYNPTIVGWSEAEIFWFNEEPVAWWAPGTVLTLTNKPLWDVVLSTVGWLIAIEPTDYTHTSNSQQVTINMDTTGEDIIVSYIVSQNAVNTELVNEVITGGASNTVFQLADEPLGSIMVSIKGWVIQIEPTDYTHTAGDDEFTMLIDTTGLDIIVTYIKDISIQQSKQSDWNETNNSKQSYIKNKPIIPTDVSQLTDTTNLLWWTITPFIVNTSTHNATVGEYILVQNLASTTINLPPAQEGEQIRIKKFTGEDVFQVIINPSGSELIDGYTSTTMNINRTMYTFTGINGNRYLGD